MVYGIKREIYGKFDVLKEVFLSDHSDCCARYGLRTALQLIQSLDQIAPSFVKIAAIFGRWYYVRKYAEARQALSLCS